jgi:hypothetical protein
MLQVSIGVEEEREGKRDRLGEVDTYRHYGAPLNTEEKAGSAAEATE